MLTLWFAGLALAQDVHPDRLLVRAAGSVVLLPGDRLAGGGIVERALDVPGWYVVTVPKDPLARLDDVRKDLRVARARGDQRVWLLAEPDVGFGTSWALENGPTLGGTFDADVDAADAWAQGARGEGVVVAVIDTGVDLTHPELADSLWTNPGEIAGNGVDDDENGYVDDVHGVDTGAHTGDPSDREGHGTACAGLIVANDDDQGPVGLAPDARILAVRVFEEADSYESAAAEGISYAAREGADVLSCSWAAGQAESELLSDAIGLARDRGALVIFSAGNEALDADENGFWPARSDDPAVISVGGSDRDDQIVLLDGLWGSTYGDETVDLLAPATVLLTTENGGGQQYFWGTSAAAPLAAATAALVWSASPDLRADDVKAAILDGVDPNGSETVTGGRLDAGNAVRLGLGGEGPRPVAISGPMPGVVGDAVVWSVPIQGSGVATWYFPDDGTFARGAEVLHTFAAPGPWRVAVEVVNGDGRRGHAERVSDVPIPWAVGPDVATASPHSGGARDGIATIDLGDVVWTRLHFDRIDLARGGEDDWVAVLDTNGHVVYSAGGSANDVWTPPLRGGAFTIEWRIADRGLTSVWGFAIDDAQVWAPGLDPAATGRDGIASGGNGCATAPSASAFAWLAFALVRRRRIR